MIFSYIFGSLVVLGAVIYLFLFSKVFEVKNIEINQTKMIDLTMLQQGISDILKQGAILGVIVVPDNILFMPTERIDNFLKSFSGIENFSWHRNIFSRKLKIDIQEREIAGILKDREKNYYFDKSGIVFAEAPSSEGGMFLIIENELNRSFDIGNCILEADAFKDLLSIVGLFNDNFDLNQIKLQKDKIEITAGLDDGHQTLFYLEIDNLKQIYSVLAYFIKNDFNFSLEYVDLRYLPNVYYK